MDVIEGFRMKLARDCAYDDTYFEFILGIIHLVPWIITFAMMGVSIVTRELFYTVTSIVSWIDIILNYVLTNMIAEPAPFENCGGSSALPAFFTEHAFFMFVYLVVAHFVYNLHLNILHIFLLQVWITMAWISSVILGFNSNYQIIAGAYVGTGTAIAVHIFFVYLIVWRNRKKIIRSNLSKRLKYVDSIFTGAHGLQNPFTDDENENEDEDEDDDNGDVDEEYDGEDDVYEDEKNGATMNGKKAYLLSVPHAACIPWATVRTCDLVSLEAANALATALGKHIANTGTLDVVEVVAHKDYSLPRAKVDMNRMEAWNTNFRIKLRRTMKRLKNSGYNVILFDMHSFPDHRAFRGVRPSEVVFLVFPEGELPESGITTQRALMSLAAKSPASFSGIYHFSATEGSPVNNIMYEAIYNFRIPALLIETCSCLDSSTVTLRMEQIAVIIRKNF